MLVRVGQEALAGVCGNQLRAVIIEDSIWRDLSHAAADQVTGDPLTIQSIELIGRCASSVDIKVVFLADSIKV